MAYQDLVLADSPIAYYRMQEASGQIQDSSGNARHSTSALGTPAYKCGGIVPGGFSMGFTTDSDEFRVPNDAALRLNGGTFSIEVWMNLQGPPLLDFPSILSLGNHTSDGWLLYLSKANGTLSFARNGVYDWGYNPGGALVMNGWRHLVITHGNAEVTGRLSFYVDAQRTLENGWDFGVVDDTSSTLRIGQYASSVRPAMLAEVALYATELSPERVTAHYAAGQYSQRRRLVVI